MNVQPEALIRWQCSTALPLVRCIERLFSSEELHERVGRLLGLLLEYPVA